MLIKSQTKTFHKVLYAEILFTPGVSHFGHVHIGIVSILVFSTVITVPRLQILQIGSKCLRLKEFRDTMHLSGYTAMERRHLCPHRLW